MYCACILLFFAFVNLFYISFVINLFSKYFNPLYLLYTHSHVSSTNSKRKSKFSYSPPPHFVIFMSFYSFMFTFLLFFVVNFAFTRFFFFNLCKC